MKKASRSVLLIVSLYALLGALWIYFSDRFLPLFVTTSAEITTWSTAKGWLYVAITSLLLYWLIRRHTKRLLSAQELVRSEHELLKSAQAALADSEEQFRQMFAKHSAMQYLVDTETLAIFDANESAQRFYGYSRDEFATLTLADLSRHPVSEVKKLLEKTYKEDCCPVIFSHRLANGDLREVEIHSTPIRLKDRHFYFNIVHDITARERAEAALRDSEARFRSLVEATTDWIWETDSNDRLTYSSPKVKTLLGYDPEQIIGTKPFELAAEEDLERITAVFYDAKKGERSFSEVECSYRHKDGKIVVLESSGMPIFDQNGKFSGFRGFERNITDRKLLEEQLIQAQKMEAVGQLAGGISHDFNNILTAITGFVFILQMKLEDEELKKYVEQIRLAAERAAGLTDSLLAFSRKQIICFKPLHINSVILETQKLLARLIREDVEIRTDLCKGDLVILGDETKIEQIIINLATNARDAMPEGGILSIRTEHYTMDEEPGWPILPGKPASYVHLTVSDTGLGIDKKAQDRIFEPFFTTKEVGKGTGLGLSIVYGLVKQLNGYIHIQSESRIGTSVNIYFPLVKAKPEESAFVQLSVPKGGGETLLVAEDDPDVRSFIRTVLEEFGYNVIEAVDGMDAVEKYRKNSDSIKAAIFDIIMPKKNGRDAYLEIRKSYPDLKAIFVSGYTGEFLTEEGILKEGLHFLPKPVVPWSLLEKVQEVLRSP
ncbi:MAG: PAS domain-containing sensor histidine kinase [Deltaproteobacteria bacterium]|nr:PAS domain-containing sensor histidine kinase [Deltaproteobacteria bacterium]TLN04054.1 MAG: PAS domain S-box protein [bacterium]